MTREVLSQPQVEFPALSDGARREAEDWIAKFEASGRAENAEDTIRALILKELLCKEGEPLTLRDLYLAVKPFYPLVDTSLRGVEGSFPYGALEALVVSLNNMMKKKVYIGSAALRKRIKEQPNYVYVLKERQAGTGTEVVDEDEAA